VSKIRNKNVRKADLHISAFKFRTIKNRVGSDEKSRDKRACSMFNVPLLRKRDRERESRIVGGW
jgi:hypothetical protein